MSINPKSVEFHQCHAKRYSICFLTTISKIKTETDKDLLTIQNTDLDLKVYTLHYANELLVRVRLSFQKLSQTLLSNMQKQYKKMLGKRVMTRTRCP